VTKKMILNNILSQLMVFISFTNVTDMISDTFFTIYGSDLLIGLILFVVFFILTLILGIGMLAGTVILLPALFLIFEFIPDLKIIVAIILGLIFGIGLHRIISR